VRHILYVVLRKEGFTVWLAADGLEALEVFRKYHESIGIVLLDIRMPRLDGPGTLTALRQLDPEVRYCFMSGDLGQYTEANVRDSGAGPVLPKPFRLEELTHRVRQLVGHAEQTAPSP